MSLQESKKFNHFGKSHGLLNEPVSKFSIRKAQSVEISLKRKPLEDTRTYDIVGNIMRANSFILWKLFLILTTQKLSTKLLEIHYRQKHLCDWKKSVLLRCTVLAATHRKKILLEILKCIYLAGPLMIEKRFIEFHHIRCNKICF